MGTGTDFRPRPISATAIAIAIEFWCTSSPTKTVLLERVTNGWHTGAGSALASDERSPSTGRIGSDQIGPDRRTEPPPTRDGTGSDRILCKRGLCTPTLGPDRRTEPPPTSDRTDQILWRRGSVPRPVGPARIGGQSRLLHQTGRDRTGRGLGARSVSHANVRRSRVVHGPVLTMLALPKTPQASTVTHGVRA
jgi:hypothetical protein